MGRDIHITLTKGQSLACPSSGEGVISMLPPVRVNTCHGVIGRLFLGLSPSEPQNSLNFLMLADIGRCSTQSIFELSIATPSGIMCPK